MNAGRYHRGMGPNDLRIAVRAAGVNRADLLQREGHYPPPPGASEILGLECAGVVREVGANVRGWRGGDRAMALLPGGGYAEEVVVHAGSAMHVPEALSDEEAAAIPEVFLTAYLTLFELARIRNGESALIHDHSGAAYLPRDREVLGMGGRIVIIGSMGSESRATIDVTRLLGKRQQIIGSTLRARPVGEKAAIVASFLERFGADLEAGRIRPVIHRVLPLAEAAEAHRLMKSSEHFGKLVLRN